MGPLNLFQVCKVVKCQGWSKLLSTPTGIDYVIIGFDMEVQALVTHTAA